MKQYTHLDADGNKGPAINMETIQAPPDYKDLITSVFGNDISANELMEKMKHSKPMPIKKDSMIVNATPNQINELITGKSYSPNHIQIRVKDDFTEVGVIDQKVPLFNRVLGEVTGLPKYKYGIYYIVSIMVRDAIPEREDLITVGEIVRDENGVIIGCKGFVR